MGTTSSKWLAIGIAPVSAKSGEAVLVIVVGAAVMLLAYMASNPSIFVMGAEVAAMDTGTLMGSLGIDGLNR
jgi:hypothetical protein